MLNKNKKEEKDTFTTTDDNNFLVVEENRSSSFKWLWIILGGIVLICISGALFYVFVIKRKFVDLTSDTVDLTREVEVVDLSEDTNNNSNNINNNILASTPNNYEQQSHTTSVYNNNNNNNVDVSSPRSAHLSEENNDLIFSNDYSQQPSYTMFSPSAPHWSDQPSSPFSPTPFSPPPLSPAYSEVFFSPPGSPPGNIDRK